MNPATKKFDKSQVFLIIFFTVLAGFGVLSTSMAVKATTVDEQPPSYSGHYYYSQPYEIENVNTNTNQNTVYSMPPQEMHKYSYSHMAQSVLYPPVGPVYSYPPEIPPTYVPEVPNTGLGGGVREIMLTLLVSVVIMTFGVLYLFAPSREIHVNQA